MRTPTSLQVMLKPDGNDRTPLLCDQHGEPLPGQLAVKIETAVGELSVVTVTFCAVRFSTDEDGLTSASVVDVANVGAPGSIVVLGEGQLPA